MYHSLDQGLSPDDQANGISAPCPDHIFTGRRSPEYLEALFSNPSSALVPFSCSFVPLALGSVRYAYGRLVLVGAGQSSSIAACLMASTTTPIPSACCSECASTHREQ
jgi:hypothetical protein